MKKAIRTVGLFGKYRNESVGGQGVGALAHFRRARGVRVLIEETTARLIPQPPAPSRALDRIGAEIDLAIVIGGDGTMLNVARDLAPPPPPPPSLSPQRPP